MPTREQVLAAFEISGDYHQVGGRFGIPPGQAYLVATGIPADGGDTYPSDEHHRRGAIDESTQALVHRTSPENPESRPQVHDWVTRRALDDGQMRAAAAARDAAPGEVLEPEETDICTVLTRDHDQVTAMLKQVKTIPGVSDGGSPVQQSRRKSIVDMISVALSQHEAAEEEHFWPVVRSLLDDGDEAAAKGLGQEQEGKDLLHRLGELEASSEEFDELAVQLDKAARKHVAFEDKVLLVIERRMSLAARRELGATLRSAERRAPSRPHPKAPKSPALAVKTAGGVAAAVDAVRDEVGDRPAKRRGRAAPGVPKQRREVAPGRVTRQRGNGANAGRDDASPTRE